MLENDIIKKPVKIAESKRRRLWDIEFNGCLFNAAGMFKNGGGYYICAAQGAAAYLAGTSTFNARTGNIKNKITHPFLPFPESHSALNWMGLPNDGHRVIAKRLSEIEKQRGCPVGVSIAADPEGNEMESLKGVIEGLMIYDKAGVDFIELNESCPNVPHHNDNADENFIKRLEYINKNYIKVKKRNIPVIVKFSVDINTVTLIKILDILIDLDFDGINIGNTSTDYGTNKAMIHSNEVEHYEYFINEYGGGVSGLPLKEKSLNLAATAIEYISTRNVPKEFHIIRTGGIETQADIVESRNAGILLNQWFTGYFEAFSQYGHKLYEKICCLL